MSQMADDALVREVAGGSTAALEALYDRHVRGCFGLAMKIVRDPNLAEEVVQDVFVKIWSSPHTFSTERGKFAGWLMTLVHNRSVDKLRRGKAGTIGASVSLDAENAHGVSFSEALADDRPSPEEQVWRGEQARLVRQVIELLPESQQEAISMAYFDGLTQREIAERLQEPLGTIKTRTRSGLRRLRRMFSQQNLLGEMP